MPDDPDIPEELRQGRSLSAAGPTRTSVDFGRLDVCYWGKADMSLIAPIGGE